MKALKTPQSPEEYISGLPEPQKSQIKEIHDFITTQAPSLIPKMWGEIIGYGEYHYKYTSGREGDWMLMGLSSRKQYISIYACATSGNQYLAEKYQEQLPKASVGKSCIRYKNFEDINWETLKKIVRETERHMP